MFGVRLRRDIRFIAQGRCGVDAEIGIRPLVNIVGLGRVFSVALFGVVFRIGLILYARGTGFRTSVRRDNEKPAIAEKFSSI